MVLVKIKKLEIVKKKLKNKFKDYTYYNGLLNSCIDKKLYNKIINYYTIIL